METRSRGWLAAVLLAVACGWAAEGRAADVVPPAVKLPGTQPGETSQIESVSKCDNCHGNFDPGGEPWFNWSGSMMAHASRDPIFWATVAVAEQDFDGSGDLCLRCHVSEGWLGGRSTPTDGSALAAGDADGVQCASPVDQKAAFNNFPYAYGVVERTYSEHRASGLDDLPVSGFSTLPLELQQGALLRAWQAAQLAGNGGDYADGTTRSFTCQTCHMRPVVGQGCNKNPPVRGDLPQHDLTGGNYWAPDAMVYLDSIGALRLGGGLTASQTSALLAGKLRAQQNLDDAAALSVAGNAVRVVNLTGHKLITGYPEGRRMWLNVRWTDAGGALLAEDNAYGSLSVDLGGAPATVETLLNLHDPYAPVYEVHGAMTREWAGQLLALGKPASLPLSFDRVSGVVTRTLGDLAAQVPGSHHETFHFVLNNFVAKDNRIPPWAMRHDAAVERNLLPVPADRYALLPDGTYPYWDEVTLNPPPGAAGATVRLLYQPTSWEYVQFLALANTGQNAFLAQEGAHLLDAWQNTGMAAPYLMASAAWQPGVAACADGRDNDRDGTTDYPDDPGCTSAVDGSENEAGRACDDRTDSDGDGWIDATQDPGCQGPASLLEDPQCDDDVDNDGDGKIDWDGGAAGGVPDPQCAGTPWKNKESKPRRCGVGWEVSLFVAPLLWAYARRRRS